MLRKLGLYSQAGVYVMAGISHFWHPQTYERIIPLWIPDQHELVFITGIIEVVLGLSLLYNPTRRVAAWALVVFLLGVFPANIQMAINFYSSGHPYFWLTIARLPLQFILIWWAWIYTRPTNP